MNSPAHQVNIRYPQTLLIKRKPFSYEEEVRLIYSANSPSSPFAIPSTGLHPVAIDPNTLFEFIELDPLMDAAISTATVAAVQTAGYNSQIRQSPLYNSPNFVVRLAQ